MREDVSVVYDSDGYSFIEDSPSRRIGYKILRFIYITIIVVICIGVLAIIFWRSDIDSIVSPNNEDVTIEQPAPRAVPVADDDHGRMIVVIGDSTASLGNGYPRGLSMSGCRVEHDTWSTMLPGSVEDWTCHGKTTAELTQSIVKGKGTPGVDTVYITAGSNDARKRVSEADILRNMNKLRGEVMRLWKGADVVWVGYLPVPSGDCLDDRGRHFAQSYHENHVIADSAMRHVSSQHGDRFVDVSDQVYDVCSDSSLVRIPGSDVGTEWHTTYDGHRVIADKILSDGT